MLSQEELLQRDHFVFTLDSCRWDTFVEAKTPFMDSLGDARKVFANCSFTFPAHLSMLKGYFPACDSHRERFFSRRAGQIYKTVPKEVLPEDVQKMAEGDSGDLIQLATYKTIPEALAEHGYTTYLSSGAARWLGDPLIRERFHTYEDFGMDTEAQVKGLSDFWYKHSDQCKFCMVNFLGTHYPFTPPAGKPPAGYEWRRNGFYPTTKKFVEECRVYRGLQTIALEEIDRALGILEGRLRNSLVIIVGDHGEDLGENGYFGHTHNSVQESLFAVPMIVHVP